MPSAPRPAKRPQKSTWFGDTRVDEYAWLSERDDPAVHEHLAAENGFTEQWFVDRTGSLRERLFTEMRGRIDERDRSVRTRGGAWRYWVRVEENDEHARHCRVRATDELDLAAGDLFLDENELAKGCEFYELVNLVISPDHRR